MFGLDLGYWWIPVIYFGVSLGFALFLLMGQLLVEGGIYSDMLWIFPFAVFFGGIFLVFMFLFAMYLIITANTSPTLCEEDC